MAKMAYLKRAAEAKGLTEYQLRRFAKEGKVPYILSGNRYIFNLDLLEDALNNMAMANVKPAEQENNQYGKLRRINA